MAVAIADLYQKYPNISKANRPYQPYGAALKAWMSGRRELVLSGPAGTGKSRLGLQKAHFCAHKYAGMRGLICRKTRHSITQTAMVTYEKKVVPEGWLEKGAIHWNTTDQQYEYANGSIIAVGGLDKASKIMSSEWDIIIVPEATELVVDDWEALITRLRNGVVPYQQLLGDCNPGPPNHWLKQRADRGATLMLNSRHQDNPMVTSEYLAGLQQLTGVRKLRLYDGLWAAADGMVYEEEWDPAIHMMDQFEIPYSWPRYWVIDWGFRHPFVLQWWAENHDGELFRYREIYITGKLVEDMARLALQLSVGEPRPVAIICDHDTEDRMTFQRHTSYETIPANKAIKLGIQDTKAMLRPARNGRPGLHFLRDSLVELDKSLQDRGLPVCTEAEFESHVWDESNGRKRGEEPVDKDNHGMDCLRYLCRHKISGTNIEELDDETAKTLREYMGY